MDNGKILNAFNGWTGMMSHGAGCAFISILEFQNEGDIPGDLLEFGVYKGKSAFLSSQFLRNGQNIDLVDISWSDELENILPPHGSVQFHHQSSEHFCKLHKRDKRRSYRFLHADGSHTFNNVWNDLKGFESLAGDDPVICLDDFYNQNYSQVQAAAFTYLAKNRSDFRFFLGGQNKAFLCRKRHFPKWKDFAIRLFPSRMNALGFPVSLSKTDLHDEFDFVFFDGLRDGESNIWGKELYAHLLKEDARAESLPSYKSVALSYWNRIKRILKVARG